MTLEEAVAAVLASQKQSKKPLAVILAGHNGSGKSTLWYGYLADFFRIPLVNADDDVCVAGNVFRRWPKTTFAGLGVNHSG